MSESHKHLTITESAWDAFSKDFDDTMAKFRVPEAERNELLLAEHRVLSTSGERMRMRYSCRI